jgi:SAM-dependent methyltransferase
VASFLFFHHLHKVGFAPYLLEFHRILRSGGLLVVLEPSALSPGSAITGLGKKIFGNVSGLVPDESPIVPSRLDESIGKAGFRLARFEGVSFSHNRMPVPLQCLVEAVSRPVARLSPLSRTAWLCVWICEKTVAETRVHPV